MEISLTAAAIAGLLSFFSPCVLPIVPFYLSYMAGNAVQRVGDGEVLSSAETSRAVLNAFFFAAGVITIFMGLGATASVFGQWVRDWFDILKYAAALLIFVMGLHFLGVLRIALLYREARISTGGTSRWSLAGSYVIGLAFAFGWTPCVGPVLAAILFAASAKESAAEGARLLFVYGAAMTFPFVLAALFVGPFLRLAARMRRHLGLVEKIMGAFLILFAILIATDTVNYIAQLMLEYGPDIGVVR